MKKSHITKSIFRNNIGFTVGLFIMYVVMIIMVFFSLLLPGSVKTAVDDFVTDYRLADAWITVMPTKKPPTEELKKIKGIYAIDQSITIDTDIKVNGEEGCSARIFSVSDDDMLRFYTYSKAENTGSVSVGITQRFASIHSVSVGDTVTVKTQNGNTDLKVGSIVTNPESMICSRDDLAQSDAYGFCYLYLPRETVDEIFGTDGTVNRFSFYFNENTTAEEIKSAITEAEDILGKSVISSVIFETSQSKAFLESELNSLDNSIRFMLFIIFFIGMCFSSFFVYQIIDKECKTIGLLRALGYSKANVFALFLKYLGGLSVIAAVTGGAVGICLVDFASGIYLDEFSLPDIVLVTQPLVLAAFLLLYFITVFLSCLISSGKISGVDPCEAYGGVVSGKVDTTNLVSRMKLPVFVKITVTSLVRHKWRLLATSLCISVCIMLMMMAVSTKSSEKQAIPASFGDRFRYDVSLRIFGDNNTLKAVSENENTAQVDECITFRTTVSFNGKKESTLINAIKEDCSLISLSDVSGNVLRVSENGILLEEWFAGKIGAKVGDVVTLGSREFEVTGLVAEYVDSTQYIAYDTAALLDQKSTNTVLVKLNNPNEQTKAINEFEQIPGVYFGTTMESYKDTCEDNFSSLGTILDIFAFLSVLLGIIIIYNMVMLSANEKRTEYATLLALGIKNREIFTMAFVENILEYIPAVAIAIPLGVFSSLTLMTVMSTQAHTYPMYHFVSSFVFSCVLSLIYIFAGVFLTIIKVKRIDPALSLNFGE